MNLKIFVPQPVRERAGAEAWIVGGKNVGTPLETLPPIAHYS
jgi:hypothetical protein